MTESSRNNLAESSGPPLPAPSTLPVAPAVGIDALADLAFDLRSGWNHEADPIWEAIAPDLWRSSGNAWLVYQNASRDRLEELLHTPRFREVVDRVQREREEAKSRLSWFETRHGGAQLDSVAFFSLEFALSEALPLYSGGLGNVAGDYLKAANDLGLPMVGVGLLYQQGYFRQAIDATGAQREFFPFNDTRLLPVAPLRDVHGEWVRVRLPRPGPPVWLRGWGARLGRIPLYLLDANDPENRPADRGITAQLYGGDSEVRILQEMALGFGGWRLLRALGLSPSVCHLNEGHAAFAGLERAREMIARCGDRFDVALAATRAGNVFTTHTPVSAGFDRFPPDLVAAQLGAYARDELGLSRRDLLALGRANPDDVHEPFNMAWLATRCSGAINAVSRRHASVSRRIFQPLFPRIPEAEVPVGFVTNGIHVPSWDSAEADLLWTKASGANRWRGTMDSIGKDIAARPDAELWRLRGDARRALVTFVRERLTGQLAASGVEGAGLDTAAKVFDGDALTIGLARRFAEYKRPTLLLRDADRLARLLTNPSRPAQIVVAGKAHPQDAGGKALVREWVGFARRPDVRPHVVFLGDYDLRLAERLVQGVDLWVNTPRPPWEACGTSGMKVLVNGGLNLSFLDGWWDEAYRPEVGWAPAGDGRDDAGDAGRLYDLLEREIIPAFYDRDPEGLPKTWIAKMRSSMADVDAALFGEPRGPGVLRTVLSARGRHVLAAHRERRRARGGARPAAPHARGPLGRTAVRRRPGAHRRRAAPFCGGAVRRRSRPRRDHRGALRGGLGRPRACTDADASRRPAHRRAGIHLCRRSAR